MLFSSLCCCEKPCGVTSRSGGAGVTTTRHSMSKGAAYVAFEYEAYSVPDHFTVTDNLGNVLFDTGGRVSGSKTVMLDKPCDATSITVRVEGPSGTAWVYKIGCPCPKGFDAFDDSKKKYRLLGIYDLDTCYLGSYIPDGHFVVKRVDQVKDQTYTSRFKAFFCLCEVVESSLYYSTIYPVGKIIDCPNVVRVDSPINSATKISLVKDPACGNADGSKIYAELSDELPNDCTDDESESSGNPLP